MMRSSPEDWKITSEGGRWHAVNDKIAVTVLPDMAEHVKIVKRNTLRPFGGGKSHRRILVARCDDVYVYVSGTGVIVTKKKNLVL